jgi:DNA-binding Lrp family transcriptional regulator
MMVTSYTLARVLPAKEEEVYRKVKTYPEVKAAVLTYGEYDLLLKIEVDSLEELDNFIFNKLRTTSGILATTTLIEAKPKWIVGEG